MLRYSSRDYSSIMKEFWEIVPKLTDLWQPDADADPGVVLGKFLASVASMLGVNLDWLANEVFGPSVTQRKNAEKLFALIGYNLGWYTAARTEVTFTNSGAVDMQLNFGFNGSNFATLNAYTDITAQPRVITYNILPLTNRFGAPESRSRRQVMGDNVNIFTDDDRVILETGKSVTRVAIEGELRSFAVSVKSVKENNYIIKLPSQHLDTTAVWIKARPSTITGIDNSQYVATQWMQVMSPADFIIPEPRFSVTYDNYSNAQIQVSNYLNQLDNYDSNWLIIYWVDCSGIIGSVGSDVLTNFLPAWPDKNSFDQDNLTISNLSNTVELPHTNTVTGKSPESAKQAYHNSRNYHNTWDSLITLPDFNRFLNREPGVDTGLVIDCQKALEINLAIYHDENLSVGQKAKMYIGPGDLPMLDEPIFDWKNILELGFDPEDPLKFVFQAGFKTYEAFCFAIHNDFQNSNFGTNRTNHIIVSSSSVDIPTEFKYTGNRHRLSSDEQHIRTMGLRKASTNIQMKSKDVQFIQYRMPPMFEQMIIRDYEPLQAMTVKLRFCYARIFPWYVVGMIYPHHPVSPDVGRNIIAKVKEDLAIHFAPANRRFGVKPTVMEVVDLIHDADSRIDYFDAGSINNPIINYRDCDVEYFNPISFARYLDVGDVAQNIRIAPEFLLK
jgi:hypothetical protein